MIPRVRTPVKQTTIEDSYPVSSNIASTLSHHPTRTHPNLKPLPSFEDLTGNTVAESSNCVFEQERCFVDEPLLGRDDCHEVYSQEDVALVDSSDVLLHANNENVDGSWPNFDCYSMPCASEQLMLPNHPRTCEASPPYSNLYHIHPDEYT